jgi:hypothetical protein
LSFARSIYHRGDTLDRALACLREIAMDPTAGRSEREAMLPEFVGLEDTCSYPFVRR